MDFDEVLLKRRSVRKFTGDEVTKNQLNEILKAGLLAPTSMNRKPCNFLVVSDKETLKELSEVKQHGSQFLAGADKAIVVIANTLKADTWIEDSSIALSFMHLMAANVGVGSCWIQIHLRKSSEGEDAEKLVRDVVKIDDYFRIVGILALGIPDGEVKPHTLDDMDKSQIHFLI
ncbi:MAG: nitroreductase family protein [Methanobrevibacter sp.]|uniref:nitroreductase family protein n=1 Tax=Methanobrevibacter sp. TaxID=66852 RepID=UPI0025E5A399|nr:nitroreductase family protein [Methanobrevibacter sp.]MBR0271683.1 nitroreductase family protein [Methanobrevibacter sp.]